MRALLTAPLAVIAALYLASVAQTFAGAAPGVEAVVEIASRGQSVRALVAHPAGPPVATVVLLAGGHGNLALSKSGEIGWGAKNQLVRTRLDYAKAGFIAITPDTAPDLKDGDGVKPRSRWSPANAEDVGAVIKHARGFGKPVYLVGTSRAALSVANAAVRLRGAAAPDALVITSGR